MKFQENTTGIYSGPFYGLSKPKVKVKPVRICLDCKNKAAKGKSRCLWCFDKNLDLNNY